MIIGRGHRPIFILFGVVALRWRGPRPVFSPPLRGRAPAPLGSPAALPPVPVPVAIPVSVSVSVSIPIPVSVPIPIPIPVSVPVLILVLVAISVAVVPVAAARAARAFAVPGTMRWRGTTVVAPNRRGGIFSPLGNYDQKGRP